MKNDEQINRQVEEALNSLDGIERAVSKPFLLTRINAALQGNTLSGWDRIAGFISRPTFVGSALCLLILVNVAVIISKKHPGTEQLVSQADEYSNTVATIYDIENIEP